MEKDESDEAGGGIRKLCRQDFNDLPFPLRATYT